MNAQHVASISEKTIWGSRFKVQSPQYLEDSLGRVNGSDDGVRLQRIPNTGLELRVRTCHALQHLQMGKME